MVGTTSGPVRGSRGEHGTVFRGALRWVRDNIAAFGGDPDAMTPVGQSAGATIVGGRARPAAGRPRARVGGPGPADAVAARPLGTTPPPADLAARTHRAWVDFATTGDPGWARYEPDRRAVQRIGSTRELVHGEVATA